MRYNRGIILNARTHLEKLSWGGVTKHSWSKKRKYFHSSMRSLSSLLVGVHECNTLQCRTLALWCTDVNVSSVDPNCTLTGSGNGFVSATSSSTTFFSAVNCKQRVKTSGDNIWSHVNQNTRHNINLRLTSDLCAQNMKDLMQKCAILGHTLSVYHISVPPKSILNCYNLSLGFLYLYPTRFQSKYAGDRKGAFVFMVRRCRPVVCALSTSR